MKVLRHPVSTAFGLAVLCCLVLIAPVITLDHLLVFHDSGPPASIFLPSALRSGDRLDPDLRFSSSAPGDPAG
jgi:hypothetical protein